MNTIDHDTLRPAPFTYQVAVAKLSRDAANPVAFHLDPEDARPLADYLELDRIEHVALDGTLSPWGKDGWRLEGTIRADLHQTCVVTLAPLVTHLSQSVERQFLPETQGGAEAAELVLAPDGPEEPDGFADTIDLGQLIIETLSLNIDPYPRAGDAAFGQRLHAAPGVEPMTDNAAKPFAALERLRRGMTPDAPD